MTLAAREDEISIAALLNISSENGLHILLRIIAYLLELINGNDTFFIGLLQTGKYLIQCIERIRNITQRKIKRWGIGNRIVTEAAITTIFSPLVILLMILSASFSLSQKYSGLI